MFAPKTLLWLVFPGLLLAILLGSWFLSGTVPFWLMAAVVAQLLWLAFGQARRMRVALGETSFNTLKHPPPAPSLSQREGLNNPTSNPIYWLWQLLILGLLLAVALFGQALWLMAKYELPFGLALQRPLQKVGVLAVPLPELVPIKSGEFGMGEQRNIVPPRQVNIDYSFDIGKYELTFEEFDHFVVAMREAGLAFQNGSDAEAVKPYPFPEDEGWGRGKRPVINVSWYQAQDYVNWLSHKKDTQCRLPSEAEWEYAARAGTTTEYWWGDEASREYANYGKDECCEGFAEGKDQWENTAPVEQFPANPFGLHDMHGNVYEWVQDYYGDYKEAPLDGSAQEYVKGDFRVLRGGSWDITPDLLRSADRGRGNPVGRNISLGFRIVCPSLNAG